MTAFRNRSQARMLALQALCTYEAVGEDFRNQLGRFLTDDENLADIGVDSPLDPETLAFAATLTNGTWTERGTLDAQLERTAAHWSLARMTPVDRNVLRLGLWELQFAADVPGAVAVDEAVDLARRFGDTASPAFVNGVLDALRTEIERRRGAPAVDRS